jgi:hypothetical protein
VLLEEGERFLPGVLRRLGFGHGIDKPKSNRAVMTHNEEWFSKWIWGEGTSPSQPD